MQSNLEMLTKWILVMNTDLAHNCRIFTKCPILKVDRIYIQLFFVILVRHRTKKAHKMMTIKFTTTWSSLVFFLHVFDKFLLHENSWLYKFRQFLDNVNIEHIFDTNQALDTQLLASKLHESFQTKWAELVRSKPKLRLYEKLKSLSSLTRPSLNTISETRNPTSRPCQF